MGERVLSLTEIQEAPEESLILLSGPPGTGKSTFCHQMVLNSIAAEKPVIFITTEQTPSAIKVLLRERGMGEATTSTLGFDTICSHPISHINEVILNTPCTYRNLFRQPILLFGASVCHSDREYEIVSC